MTKLSLTAGIGLVLLLCSTGFAQDRQSALFIGGPGSCADNGTSDPGRLGDSVTVAKAQLAFFLDRENANLFLSVENTSPVVTGVDNPLLVRIYLNAPPQVTGMTLVSQTATDGATPAFTLAFDADRSTAPNPNTAPGFGGFNVLLDNPGGTNGAIVNAAADQYVGSNQVVGPVTFVFALQGDLATVVADDFATRYSSTGNGKPALGVCKFRAGGEAHAYGYISESTYCASAAASTPIGAGCGATLSATVPVMGSTCTMTVEGNAPNSVGWAYFSMVGSPAMFQGCDVFVSSPRWLFLTFTTDDSGVATFQRQVPDFFFSPECCGLSFMLQSVVLSDSGPLRIGEITNGVMVTVGG